MQFAAIQEALEEIKKGRMLVLLDESREKEADFYMPADTLTEEAVTTMIKKGGGLICAAITSSQANKLELPLMVDIFENKEKTGVNFTVSADAKKGITTGVSSGDRYKTIKVMTNPASKPFDLVKPGHVFGLIAKRGGVLQRSGHTESAVTLSTLAGFSPAGVLCEILSDEGSVAGIPYLYKLSNLLKIKAVLIRDLVEYVKKNPLPETTEERYAVKSASSILPTKYGLFKIIIFKSLDDGREHAALTLGKLKDPVLTRIHSQCLTGDTLFSLRCDCGEQLRKSMELISKEGSGAIIYLNQEGRGIGLTNKIKAYAFQDKGFDTVEANEALGFPSDARSYKVAADILKKLKIDKINLLTNNPDKKDQLSKYGIEIYKRTALEVEPNKADIKYLEAKKRKMKHSLKFV